MTRDFERKMLDTIGEVIQGTPVEPPEGGIIVDALVVMIYVDQDGEYGTSWMSAGSIEQAEGMAHYALRSIDAVERHRLFDRYHDTDDLDDDDV